MKVIIPVNQQLDPCGDEFLDARDFEIVVDDACAPEYLKCAIGDMENCFIRKRDLKKLLMLLYAEVDSA